MNRRTTSKTWLLGLAISGMGGACSLAAQAQTAAPIAAPAPAPADDEAEINRLLDENKPAEALRLSERALVQTRLAWGERDPRSIELLARADDALAVRDQASALRTAVPGADGPPTLEDGTNRLASLAYLSRLQAVGHDGHLLFSARGDSDPNRPVFSTLVLKPDGEGPEHDGFVSAAEWLPLRLNSDRVVRSACDTARGPVVSGDGLVGFVLYGA